MVNEFYSVCTRKRVNAWKNKVMMFERKKVEVIDFNTSYRVNVPTKGKCEVYIR